MIKRYYKKRNGELYTAETKEEISSKINPNILETFLPYLEILDYPYLQDEWQKIIEFAQKHNRPFIFGKYIARMRLMGYRPFSYQDSDMLNAIRLKRKEEVNLDIN